MTTPDSEKIILLKRLEEVAKLRKCMEDAWDLAKILRTVSNLFSTDSLNAAKTLKKSMVTINKYLSDETFSQFYKFCRKHLVLENRVLSTLLTKKWKEVVYFETSTDSKMSRSNALKLNVSKMDELASIVASLQELENPFLKSFATNLLNYFLKPILTYPCDTDTCMTDGIISICITYSIKSSDLKNNNLIKQIFSLVEIFTFINQHFFLNYKCNIINAVGEYCSDEFISLLIQKYALKSDNYANPHLINITKELLELLEMNCEFLFLFKYF